MQSEGKERKLLSLIRWPRDQLLRSDVLLKQNFATSAPERWGGGRRLCTAGCGVSGLCLLDAEANPRLTPAIVTIKDFPDTAIIPPWRGRSRHHCSEDISRVCQRQIFTLISETFTLTMTISRGIFLLPNKKISIYTHDLLVHDILTLWSCGAHQF